MRSSFDCDPKKVTVVIPNWNGMNWLSDCLQSLARQDTPDFGILIIDNGSTDGSMEFIKQNHPNIEVVSLPNNTGFANAANIGIEKSATPYIVFLNADTRVYPDWLSSLLDRIENSPPEIAAINSQMLRMDDPERLDDAGDEMTWFGATIKRGYNQLASGHDEEVEVFSACAGAALYRRDFLLETGGFDPAFFAYLEDVDLGLRGRLLGYRYLYLPKAKVIHKGHGSNIDFNLYVELITRNRLLLFVKNIPSSLLLRHAPKLLYGQIYFFAAYARPWASIRGYLSFCASLPKTIRKRARILSKVTMNLAEMDRLLGKNPPSPTLCAVVSGYLSSLMQRKKALLSGNSVL
jgi:GT2 family glycosyltransferase